MATRKPAQTATRTPSFRQNLSDDQLDGVVREPLAEGLTTVNAMSKALRGRPGARTPAAWPPPSPGCRPPRRRSRSGPRAPASRRRLTNPPPPPKDAARRGGVPRSLLPGVS